MSAVVLSIVGQVLLLAVLLALLVGNFVRDKVKFKLVLAGLLLLGMLIPLYGLSIAQWLRSAVGDLSVLTMVILLNILSKRLFDFNLLKPVSRQYLLWGIVITGTLFYPFALGVGSVDPYHYGFAPVGLSVLLTLLSIVSWIAGKRDLAVVVLLPLLSFNLQMLESGNLWDYVIDPVLFMYALVQSVNYFWKNRLIKGA